MKQIFTLLVLTVASLSNAQLTPVYPGKTFGGSGDDGSTAMTVATDGSVYITGNFKNTVDFDPSNAVFNLTADGIQSIFIQKLDNAGNLLWVKKIANGITSTSPKCKVTTDGGVVITGEFKNTIDIDPGAGISNITATFSEDFFVLKLNSAGNFVWGKSITTLSSDSEYISAVEVDSSGNIFLAGYFSGPFTIGGTALTSSGSYDGFIHKMDANGTAVWTKKLGGTDFDAVFSMTVGPDNNVYATGVFLNTVDFDPGVGTFNLTSNGLYNGFYIKLDNAGNFIWARSLGGIASDYVGDVQVLADGNLVGIFNFTSPTVTINVAGTNVVFNKNTPAGNAYDYIIFKADANGAILWAKEFGTAGDDSASSIAIDVNDKIYIFGNFANTLDFNPGNAVNAMTSSGNSDTFIQCFTSDGVFQHVSKIGGTGVDIGYKTIYQSGKLYITGQFTDTINLNPSTGSPQSVPSNGGKDYFFCKFSIDGLLDSGNHEPATATLLYPNPSTGSFNIETEFYEQTSVRICDFSGRIVQEYNLNSKITTNTLPSGVYLIEISSKDKRTVKKLIIQ